MDKQEFLRRLMATFLTELEEHIGDFNNELLQLEKAKVAEQQQPHLQQLMRTAHCLKGAARAVNIELLEQSVHKLEGILIPYQDGSAELQPENFGLLFRTVDAIEEAGQRLQEEQTLGDSPLEKLQPELDAAIERLTGTLPTDSIPDPASVPPGNPSATRQPEQLVPETTSPTEETETPPPAVQTETPPAAKSSTPGASRTVRIPAEKLDSLLTQTGELLVARQRMDSRAENLQDLQIMLAEWKSEWRGLLQVFKQLQRQPEIYESHSHISRAYTLTLRPADVRAASGCAKRFKNFEKQLNEVANQMNRDGRLLNSVSSELEEEVHRVRLFPFSECCAGLERTVRDIAQQTGKQVKLIVHGDNVQVDRSVLEGLKDPLMHLVRNAVDHGVEAPQVREELQKPAHATVTVSAQLRGSRMEIRVSDDGRGFNLDAIREKARRRNIPLPNSEHEVARLVFLPGFSTSEIITDVSGRGVGLDVVKSRIETLHGNVDLNYQKDIGTEFTVSVPLTLTTIRCVLVRVATHAIALDSNSVVRFLEFNPAEVQTSGGREILLDQESPVPIVNLATLLHLEAPEAGKESPPSQVIILSTAGQSVAFLIDAVLAEKEILVKPLGRRIGKLSHISGGTILPSGEIALVMNGHELTRRALGVNTSPIGTRETETHETAPRKRLLIVDDSATTLALLNSILETAGYDVTMAEDGLDAWEKLQEAEFDLVVSDVDMPRLDGFSLTRKIRESSREHLREIPVVLVTARNNNTDRKRGVEFGANAYVVKGSFNQDNLLQSIQQLL